MVPLVRPTKPPTTLFGPVLVTAPWALEFVISPGPFWKLSVPMNPPSTLLPPPVTAPIAELATIVPLLVPAKPPATLESPTVTLPLANDDVIDPAPRLKTFWPTSPPTVLNAPPLTLPLADESVMVPRLVATSPPAVFEAVVELESPTLTVAAELELAMTPLFCPTRPPASTPVCEPLLTLPLRI